MWHDQNTESISFSLIKQRILDNFRQSWYAEINNSSRLSTHSRIKHDFNQEKYLNTVNEKKYRIALTKFRISAHNLEIEKGRTFRVCGHFGPFGASRNVRKEFFLSSFFVFMKIISPNFWI